MLQGGKQAPVRRHRIGQSTPYRDFLCSRLTVPLSILPTRMPLTRSCAGSSPPSRFAHTMSWQDPMRVLIQPNVRPRLGIASRYQCCMGMMSACMGNASSHSWGGRAKQMVCDHLPGQMIMPHNPPCRAPSPPSPMHAVKSGTASRHPPPHKRVAPCPQPRRRCRTWPRTFASCLRGTTSHTAQAPSSRW